MRMSISKKLNSADFYKKYAFIYKFIAFNLIFFVAYIVNDIFWDGLLAQSFNYGMVLLLAIIGMGFVWHISARSPHIACTGLLMSRLKTYYSFVTIIIHIIDQQNLLLL